MSRFCTAAALLAVTFGLFAGTARADEKAPDAAEVKAVVAKALDFLKTTQGPDGSFSPKRAGPGITAVVVAGLLRAGVSPKEPVVAKALQYLEKSAKDDGGIYDKFLANYTTSVAVMAFKEANTDGKYDAMLKKAGEFLKQLQNQGGPDGAKGLLFGGFGYDAKSRPDMSNSNFAVEALLAAGLSKDDPAVKNALQFINRCQNLPGESNKQPWAAKVSEDDKGGFVYVPDPDDKAHQTAAGGLRSTGAMSYAGLKTFLYAGVSKDDERVKAVVQWTRKHYTLKENPGQGASGLYYYYHTFAKAMAAFGEDPFADAAGKKHFWRRELFDAISSKQQANGSWSNAADTAYGEADPNLATGFAFLALSYCEASKK